MIRLIKPYVLALLLFTGALSCRKTGSTYVPPPYIEPKDSTFLNPLLTSGPDPWVIKKDSFYYYSNTSGDKIQLWTTKALSQLGNAPVQTIWTKSASGPHSENIWAPELHYLDGKWYMYFTGGSSPDLSTQRLFVLENTSPDPLQGTWVDKGKIADPAADFFAIDATILDMGSSRYILWSGQPSASDNTQQIYIAQLANPYTVSGSRFVISTPTYSWEKYGGAVNEGPEVLKNSAGKIFITYSASSCSTDDYALGMLTLKDGGNPLNAADWIKTSTPVFSKKVDNGVFGPGHNSFFKSPDATEDWILYHANPASGQGCGDTRSPRIQKFTWKADGTPDFGVPVKINVEMIKPSGEY